MISPNLNLGLLAGHNIWQSIIILSIVFAILKIIKKASAEERSWSWSATLFALALLPMAAFLPGEGIKLENKTPIFSAEKLEPAAMPTALGTETKFKNKQKLKTTITTSTPLVSKDDIIVVGLLVWLFGSSVSMLRLLLAGYNASSLRKSAYPYVSSDPEFDRKWPENIEIAISDDVNGPIVIGVLKPIVLIPRGFAYEMNAEELKPLLFHELAHIKRRDNILHLVERLILCVYWWNPVMHYIATRISEERELACDDRAAKSCGDHIVYAKSLLKGARQIVGQNKPILGLAVLKRESPLSKRVKRLTDTSVFSGPNFKRLGKNLSLVFSCIVCLGLITPRIANGQIEIDRDGHSSVSTMTDDMFIDVEWQGNLVLNEQESDIITMDEDGYFSLETEQGGIVRKLTLKSDGDEISREFLIYGEAEDSDEAKYVWQAENMKRMLRLSAINAEKRVDHIYANGGADAVLGEIDQLLSDYAIRLYTESLVDVYELDQSQIRRLIKSLDNIESGYEKELALTAIADEQNLHDETAELLAQVIEKNDNMELVREDIVLALADIETEAGALDLEIELHRQQETELSEQEIELMREEIEHELENLPTEEELAEILERAEADLPTEAELVEIIAEAKADLPTEAELAEILAEAQAELPTAEELEEIIKQSTAHMLSAKERARIVEETIAEMPTQEELTRIVEEAMTEMPTQEEITRMVEEARASMPSQEEFARILAQAKAEIPTKDELDQIRENVRKELKELQSEKHKLKKDQEELQ